MNPIPTSDLEYCCHLDLDLYDAPSCERLATQAAAGRHLRFLSATPTGKAMLICSCEDGYESWLPVEKVSLLEPVSTVYHSRTISRSEIEKQIRAIIAFTQEKMKQPNHYLWGGNIGPNFDCSGLVQAAFAHSNIWLPRDSYQQEAFTATITVEELQVGDLIFFGTKEKVNHVALHLGDLFYIHSSGKEKGRNGIGIDRLDPFYNKVSQSYYHQFWGCGRVMSNYIP
ncbi:MAG: C40 family peptidase [Prochloron sp. SP5CPC1]|nr:C40 family peptidase [Candidatus Paraprochloron terpiosi SP5CPC1]